MLIDTNIFVDFARGYQPAREFIYNDNNVLEISVISLMEYIRGTANLVEAKKFEDFVDKRAITILHVDEHISLKAYEFYKTFFHKLRLSYMDTIILATAYVRKIDLCTRDLKHMSFCEEVRVIRPYS